MGARAAVTTLNDRGVKEGKLVLANYPLSAPSGSLRDQILLDIHPGVEVLFISGDRDGMCDLTLLNQVRAKMKARSWLIVARGADHGISSNPKGTVEKVRECIATAAARWANAEGRKEGMTECIVR